ncbi:LCP family protein [Candidatus Daviesbacteria bacterium]|nr:LCP family protein [Candidatus Daviesbacteria bacterium]
MPTKKVLPKSSKNWKDVRSKTKIKKKTQLALLVLGILIVFLILSQVMRFTQSLVGSKKYSWDGQYNINLLIRSKDISLLTYSPTDNKIIMVNIPDETFLQLPYGFGSWQARSIYDLGESQKRGGNKLLKETLTAFFAIPVDGYLDISSLKSTETVSDLVDVLRKNPVSGISLLSQLKTDLTMWELLKLKWGMASVRFDKIKQLDLVELNVLQKETLADGTPIFTSDPIKMDSVLADFQDPKVATEGKTIAVFNSTDQPQLAQKWARLVTNLGGDVIIVSNTKTKLKRTQVSGEQSLTLKRLQQIFVLDCQNSPKCDNISPTEDDIAYQRAQINLLLGEDYISR